MKKQLKNKFKIIIAPILAATTVVIGILGLSNFDSNSKNQTLHSEDVSLLNTGITEITNQAAFYQFFNVANNTQFSLQSTTNYDNYLSNTNNVLGNAKWETRSAGTSNLVISSGTLNNIALTSATNSNNHLQFTSAANNFRASWASVPPVQIGTYSILVNGLDHSISLKYVDNTQAEYFLSSYNFNNPADIVFVDSSSLSASRPMAWFNISFDLSTPSNQLPPGLSEVTYSYLSTPFLVEFTFTLNPTWTGSLFYALTPNVDDRSISSAVEPDPDLSNNFIWVHSPENITINLTLNQPTATIVVDYSKWGTSQDSSYTWEILHEGTSQRYRPSGGTIDFTTSKISNLVSDPAYSYTESKISFDFTQGENGSIVEWARSFDPNENPDTLVWTTYQGALNIGTNTLTIQNLSAIESYSLAIRFLDDNETIQRVDLNKFNADYMSSIRMTEKEDTLVTFEYRYHLGAGPSANIIEFGYAQGNSVTNPPSISNWVVVDPNRTTISATNLTQSTTYYYAFRTVADFIGNDGVYEEFIFSENIFRTLSSSEAGSAPEINNFSVKKNTQGEISSPTSITLEFYFTDGGQTSPSLQDFWVQLNWGFSGNQQFKRTQPLFILTNLEDRYTGNHSLVIDFSSFKFASGTTFNTLPATEYEIVLFDSVNTKIGFDTFRTSPSSDRVNISFQQAIANPNARSIDFTLIWNIDPLINFDSFLHVNLYNNTLSLVSTKVLAIPENNGIASPAGAISDSFTALSQGIYYIDAYVEYSGYLLNGSVSTVKYKKQTNSLNDSIRLGRPIDQELIQSPWVDIDADWDYNSSTSMVRIFGNLLYSTGTYNPSAAFNATPITKLDIDNSIVYVDIRNAQDVIIQSFEIKLLEVLGSQGQQFIFEEVNTPLSVPVSNIAKVTITPQLTFIWNTTGASQQVPFENITFIGRFTPSPTRSVAPPAGPSSDSNNALIWGIVGGVAALLLLILFFWWRKRRKEKRRSVQGPHEHSTSEHKPSLKEDSKNHKHDHKHDHKHENHNHKNDHFDNKPSSYKSNISTEEAEISKIIPSTAAAAAAYSPLSSDAYKKSHSTTNAHSHKHDHHINEEHTLSKDLKYKAKSKIVEWKIYKEDESGVREKYTSKHVDGNVLILPKKLLPKEDANFILEMVLDNEEVEIIKFNPKHLKNH